jgi:DNA ligase-1
MFYFNSKRQLCCFFVFLVSALCVSAGDKTLAPALQLANNFHPHIQLDNYWVSEKLDGVRAYWNGQQLLSKQGYVYQAPGWFLEDFPEFALDGELWLDRGKFDRLSGIVRKQQAIDEEWALVSYQVFDLPEHPGNFDERLKILQDYFQHTPTPAWLYLIPQFKVSSQRALEKLLNTVVADQGEGLMLHKGTSYYHAGRDDDLLKLKTYDDAEAIVLDYLPGKGKHEGRMGALLVKAVNHQQRDKVFRIGTGFSDAQRENPPPIGGLITYKYFGLSSNGVPRFASYMRVREGG